MTESAAGVFRSRSSAFEHALARLVDDLGLALEHVRVDGGSAAGDCRERVACRVQVVDPALGLVDAREHDAAVLLLLDVERERAAVVRAEDVVAEALGVVALEDVLDRHEVAERLAHLLLVDLEEAAVHPVARELGAR